MTNAYDFDWPVVEVQWVDSTAKSNWSERGEWALQRSEIKSVGYLFKDLSDRVVLVQSMSGLDLIDHQLSIPRGCIKSMYYLWGGEDL